MIKTKSTHFVLYDKRVNGWVVVARLPTGDTVVSRPRSPNLADDKRLEFDKATAGRGIPLYENVGFYKKPPKYA